MVTYTCKQKEYENYISFAGKYETQHLIFKDRLLSVSRRQKN